MRQEPPISLLSKILRALKKIWHDPVMAKVIAAGIIAVIGFVSGIVWDRVGRDKAAESSSPSSQVKPPPRQTLSGTWTGEAAHAGQDKYGHLKFRFDKEPAEDGSVSMLFIPDFHLPSGSKDTVAYMQECKFDYSTHTLRCSQKESAEIEAIVIANVIAGRLGKGGRTWNDILSPTARTARTIVVAGISIFLLQPVKKSTFVTTLIPPV